MTDRRRYDRRIGKKDRRWFYPRRIQNRGKTSLPFTTREPDFVCDCDRVECESCGPRIAERVMAAPGAEGEKP